MRRLGPLLIIGCVLGLDHWSKHAAERIFGGVATVVPGLFSLRLVYNRGMLFSLGEGPDGGIGALLIWLLWTAAVGLLCLLAARTPAKKPMRLAGFACMIGGALSNGLDRALDGRVTDFLQLGPLPILNVADVAFLIGAALVITDVMRAPAHRSR